mmetsp:Transcript_44618/g.72745  ORF Transcript_44618/g.72745 Transcript_44618/m.72745 type:complete len:98 (-) Transcript_44618:299-592(-)
MCALLLIHPFSLLRFSHPGVFFAAWIPLAGWLCVIQPVGLSVCAVGGGGSLQLRSKTPLFYSIFDMMKTIQLHLLVCSAFNAGFDGDQIAMHVPLSI